MAVTDLPQIQGKTLLVIDFMMLLRMVLTDTCDCSTFGELSDKLLNIVINSHSYTAVVGDSYQVDKSIKAGERARRGKILMQEIRNPSRDTPLPKQRIKMLSNPRNKANIADFLFQDWVDKCMDRLEDGQYLYLAGGFLDPQRTVLVTRGFQRDVPELKSDQEEADSRMFLHISYAQNMLKPVRTILWSIDSDVEAMCPRYCILLGINELYFTTGVKQKKRFIPIHKVVEKNGHDMSLVLPVIHALSGCDSTSSFSGIGKLRWFKTVQSHPELIS